MFTVVELIEEKRKGFGDFIKLLRKPETKIETVGLENGKCFYICKSEMRRGRVSLKDIESLSPSKNFLVPDFYSEKISFNAWIPKSFPQIMLFNSFVAYVKEKNLPPSKTHITVVDKEGVYVNFFKEVIELASSITVITTDERYKNLSDELLSAFGVSLIIREEFSEEKSANAFLLDYNAESVPLSYKGTVFSKNKKHLLNGKSLTPGGFDLPDEYEKLRSEKINKLYLASALYELCDVKELQSLKFNELCS